MSAEHARVDRIHSRELPHVEEKDAAAQHVLEVGAGRFENGLDIPETLLGLNVDVLPGQRAGGRIGGALTGDEDETIESDARRVRIRRVRAVRQPERNDERTRASGNCKSSRNSKDRQVLRVRKTWTLRT